MQTAPVTPAEQGGLFGPAAGPARRGPWIKPCLVPGPYAIRRPTPRSPFRLEVLTCTRPAGHDGPNHYHIDADARVVARWSRAGEPVFPPIMKGV